MDSKAVKDIGSAALGRHEDLRERCTTFANFDTRAEGQGSWFPQNAITDRLSNLVMAILADPHMSPYVQSIILQRWHPTWDSGANTSSVSPEGSKLLHLAYSQAQFEAFKGVLSRFILPVKLEKWNSWLEGGNEDAVMGLLLLVAPSIQDVEFDKSFTDGPEYLKKLTQVLAADTKLEVPPVLGNFHHLHFDGRAMDPNASSLDVLFVAASLPSLSLESISVSDICAFGFPHNSGCLVPKSSNVKTLNFTRSALTSAQMDDLLHGFTALESFTDSEPLMPAYEDVDDYEDADMPSIPHFNPTALCATLQAHTKDTLVFLCLRPNLEEKLVPTGFIDGLYGFKNLRYLEISMSLVANRGGPEAPIDLPLPIKTIRLLDSHMVNIYLVEKVLTKIIKAKPVQLCDLATLAIHIEGVSTRKCLELFAAPEKECKSRGVSFRINDVAELE